MIRNIEIRSAIQHLAEIAGYKLASTNSNSNQQSEEVNVSTNQLDYEMLASRVLENSDLEAANNNKTETNNQESELTNLVDKSEETDQPSLVALNQISNYTLHIQAAYNQVNQLFARDKQFIVELIRRKKNNDFKLRELEKLRVKVSNSLTKLKQLDENLGQMIRNDVGIEEALIRLSNRNHYVTEQEQD